MNHIDQDTEHAVLRFLGLIAAVHIAHPNPGFSASHTDGHLE